MSKNLIDRYIAWGEREKTRMNLSQEAQTLLKRFHKMKNSPSGDRHAAAYDAFHGYALEHESAVIELVFSGVLQESEIDDMLYAGGHGGSLKKEYNTRIVNRTAKIRERKEELPFSVQMSLDWLERVHGW